MAASAQEGSLHDGYLPGCRVAPLEALKGAGADDRIRIWAENMCRALIDAEAAAGGLIDAGLWERSEARSRPRFPGSASAWAAKSRRSVTEALPLGPTHVGSSLPLTAKARVSHRVAWQAVVVAVEGAAKSRARTSVTARTAHSDPHFRDYWWPADQAGCTWPSSMATKNRYEVRSPHKRRQALAHVRHRYF